MQHGIWLTCRNGQTTADLVDLGAQAEAGGWDGVFVSDSLSVEGVPDPWVALAGIAARTSDVTLGTWVTPAPRRDPWQLAQELASLDELSGGRVLLGVGLGNEEEYEPYNHRTNPRARGSRLDESLEVLTRLWTGDPVTFAGEHFEIDEAVVTPTPVQSPRIPILCACFWPNEKPFRRGARWDGIMPYFPSMMGEGGGPHGEQTTGTPEEEVREALSFYGTFAPDDSEVVLADVPGLDRADFLDLCSDLGVTWTLRTETGDSADALAAAVSAGPSA